MAPIMNSDRVYLSRFNFSGALSMAPIMNSDRVGAKNAITEGTTPQV